MPFFDLIIVWLNSIPLCFHDFPVSRAESHDNASVPRAGWRRKGIRVGAQVARLGADSIFGEKTLHGSDPSGQFIDRVAVPKRFIGDDRLGIQSNEIAEWPVSIQHISVLFKAYRIFMRIIYSSGKVQFLICTCKLKKKKSSSYLITYIWYRTMTFRELIILKMYLYVF